MVKHTTEINERQINSTEALKPKNDALQNSNEGLSSSRRNLFESTQNQGSSSPKMMSAAQRRAKQKNKQEKRKRVSRYKMNDVAAVGDIPKVVFKKSTVLSPKSPKKRNLFDLAEANRRREELEKNYEKTTFDMLRDLVKVIEEEFSKLTEISAQWEERGKDDTELEKSGLKKHLDGTWRDFDGVIVEAKSVTEDKEREKTKMAGFKCLDDLKSRKKIEGGNFREVISTYKEISDGANNVIRDMYPSAIRERRFSIAHSAHLEGDFLAVDSPILVGDELNDLHKYEISTVGKVKEKIQEYGLDEVSKVHRDERFHIRKQHSSSPTNAKKRYQGRFNQSQPARTFAKLDEEDTRFFNLQVELAMLKGQKMEKQALVDSQGESGARNQEELDELYVKTAQMKIKHLLEVIERQQDTFSSIGVQFETLEEAVSRKEDQLNKMIDNLSKELSIDDNEGAGAGGDKVLAFPSPKSAITKTIPETNESEEEKHQKLEKENQRLAAENQVLLEQLERITTTAASNTNVDELEEINSEAAKALKLREVKSNRLKRLEATCKEKAYNVKNARELALNAYKAKLEEETVKMNEQIEKTARELLFAKACRETYIISEQMKKAEKLDDVVGLALQDKANSESINHKEGSSDTKHKFLATANAMISFSNIEAELSKMQRTYDVAEAQVASEEKKLEHLILKLERLENAEIITLEEMKANPEKGGKAKKNPNNLMQMAAMAAANIGGEGGGEETKKKKKRGQLGAHSEAADRAKSIMKRNRSLFVDTNLANKAGERLEMTIPGVDEGMEMKSPLNSPMASQAPLEANKGSKSPKMKKRAKSMMLGGGVASPENSHSVDFKKEAEIARLTGSSSPKQKTRGRSMMPTRQDLHENVKQKANELIISDNQMNQFKMTKEQQLQEIINVKGEINAATEKRLKTLLDQKKTRQNLLTLKTLCNEGRKRLQKKDINTTDRDAYHKLALLHKEFANKLSATVKLLSCKKLTNLRSSYVAAKIKHVQKLLDDDPHAKGHSLTGLLTHDADEKQLNAMANEIKTVIKKMNKQIVDKTRRLNGDTVLEERKMLRELKADHITLAKKWNKIETSGGSGMEQYSENRQIMNLQASKVEASRKLNMLNTRIKRALGVHEAAVHTAALERKRRGEGRKITKKEEELERNITVLKKQAVWWKRRLGVVIGKNKGDKSKASPGSTGMSRMLEKLAGEEGENGNDSPKATPGFISALAKRAERRSLEKKPPKEIDLETIRTEVEAEVVSGEDGARLAMTGVDAILASDAGAIWRRKSRMSRQARASRLEEHSLTGLAALTVKGIEEEEGEDKTSGDKPPPEEKKSATVPAPAPMSPSGLKVVTTTTTSKEKAKHVPLLRKAITMNSSTMANINSVNSSASSGGGGGTTFEKMDQILSKLREDRRKEEGKQGVVLKFGELGGVGGVGVQKIEGETKGVVAAAAGSAVVTSNSAAATGNTSETAVHTPSKPTSPPPKQPNVIRRTSTFLDSTQAKEIENELSARWTDGASGDRPKSKDEAKSIADKIAASLVGSPVVPLRNLAKFTRQNTAKADALLQSVKVQQGKVTEENLQPIPPDKQKQDSIGSNHSPAHHRKSISVTSPINNARSIATTFNNQTTSEKVVATADDKSNNNSLLLPKGGLRAKFQGKNSPVAQPKSLGNMFKRQKSFKSGATNSAADFLARQQQEKANERLLIEVAEEQKRNDERAKHEHRLQGQGGTSISTSPFQERRTRSIQEVIKSFEGLGSSPKQQQLHRSIQEIGGSNRSPQQKSTREILARSRANSGVVGQEGGDNLNLNLNLSGQLSPKNLSMNPFARM